ncbi:MAG TPA: hypothetical protein VF363_03755 [Candidatus Eisenbacteria bacterium]
MSACAFCGTPLDSKMRVPREAECPNCGRDLHACVQCRHFDPTVNNQCREPQAEWIVDRERRNFCDYFSLNPAARAGIRTVDRAKDARQKLDQLFKTKEPESE